MVFLIMDLLAQKPFMMCHPLQGLIKKDKRQEVITIVQSKSYFKGGNEAQVLFCFKAVKQLLL